MERIQAREEGAVKRGSGVTIECAGMPCAGALIKTGSKTGLNRAIQVYRGK